MVIGIGKDRESRSLIGTGASLTLAALFLAACGSSSAAGGNPATIGTGANGGAATTNPPGDGANGGAALANAGTGSASSDGTGGSGGSSVFMGAAGTGPNATCVPAGATGPTLPPSFYANCTACHSANGSPANPAVPNLFTKMDTQDVYTSTIRTGKAIMPPFTAAQISDADIAQIYAYFKAGVPGNAPTCVSSGGMSITPIGTCSGLTVSYEPIFADGTSTLAPIAQVDPTTKHIIFRGAGRVRFRHEMEDTYEIYHDHYFEGRTFGYILDDSSPAGGKTITVTFLPSGNQYYSKQTNAGSQEGGADLNIRAWKLYGHPDGNAFAANAGGAANNVLPFGCASDPNGPTCDTTKYTYVINRNDREGRDIMVGDQLQIEFGIFLARYQLGTDQGPPVDLKHVRNILPIPGGCTENGPPFNNACYTQANYYSDSFRYVVGKGTLTPYNQDCTMSVPPGQEGAYGTGCDANGAVAKAVAAGTILDRMGPDEPGWSGGTATIPYIRQRHDLYYSQMAPSTLQENAENFVQGRRLFHTDFTTGQHIEVNNELTAAEAMVHANIAGPLMNQVSCEGCHVHNNRGFPPATAGAPFDSVVVRIYGTGKDANGVPNGDPNYGRQLQPKAVSGAGEGSASFTYTPVTGMFKDGTPYTLTKPTTTFSGMTAGNPTSYSTRMARPLIGIGLLEAIPEADILAHADPTDCNKDGISGVPNIVFDPEDGKTHVGRFGWKAAKASVKQQVSEALYFDLGFTTSTYPKDECGVMEASCTAADKATVELSDPDVNLLMTYMRLVAVPPRRDLADKQVVAGEALFREPGLRELPLAEPAQWWHEPIPGNARTGDSPLHRSAATRHGSRSGGR